VSFFIVGNVVVQEIKDGNQGQLLHTVLGQGGTGKTRIATALRMLFHVYGKDSMLKCTAHQASAAALIGGHTIDSLCGFYPSNANKTDEEDTDQPSRTDHMSKFAVTPKLRQRWEGTRFLMIDEISLISSCKLRDIDVFLRCMFDPDLAFGGLHIIALGDFLQLPPVQKGKGTNPPLYETAFTSTEKGAGRLLWEKFTSCVKLTECKRATDPELVEILGAIRAGKVTKKMHTKLRSRVLANLPDQEKAKFLSEATILTPTNRVRTAISHQFSLSIPAGLQQRALVLMSVDRYSRTKSEKLANKNTKKKPPKLAEDPTLKIDPILQQVLWTLPDNSTGKRPGMLVLYKGARMVIPQNIHPELGLFTSNQVTVEKLVLDNREPPFDPNPSLGAHVLRYYPAYVVVSIDGPRRPVIPGFPIGQVPIFASSATFDYTKKIGSSTATVSISRSALALSPAKARTVHRP
jgi:hypothetical protein